MDHSEKEVSVEKDPNNQSNDLITGEPVLQGLIQRNIILEETETNGTYFLC